MRFKIHGLFLAASLMAPALAGAAMCDDTYYLQAAAQTVWEGTNAKALQLKEAKAVTPNLANLTVLDNLMNYTLITKFEGACSKSAKPVTFRTKPSGSGVFKDSLDNGYQVQMFDTNTIVSGHKFNYWFGFFNPAATLRFFLGRTDSQGPEFTGWYVGIYYSDSTKESSGLWKETGHFYHLQGPDDSLTLEKQVLDETIRKLPANGDTYRAHYKVQFLKVDYENKAAPIAIRPERRAAPTRFQAVRAGELVLIHPGDPSVAGQPLSVYGMLGGKIATLHPTGFVYAWNGKTAAGSDAPTGVYFIQAGNRTLGKFFYSR